MDRLTQSQSQLLKRISVNPVPYDSLTEDEQAICDFFIKLKYVTYHTVGKSHSRDGVFLHGTEIVSVSISETGKMYLINEQLSDEQRAYLKNQIDSLKHIADSAKTQAKLAIEAADIARAEAKVARRDAIFSKAVSIIAIIISIAAIVVPLIY